MVYAVLGALWILSSNFIRGGSTQSLRETLRQPHTAADLAYVILTCLLVWWLVRRAVEAVEGATVHFLFTSGYAAHEITGGDIPERDLALLQKPWTLADLTHRVREVLDRTPKEEE